MSEVEKLVQEVQAARQRVVASVRGLSVAQGDFKPAPARWSVSEVLEHLVLAEHLGIVFIWKASLGYRQGTAYGEGASVNRGLSIEQVVEQTWKAREEAPPGATPRLGGPLPYWVAALEACQPVLEQLADELEGLDLSAVIYPHFLSGPLDARQRLEFLRFHLDRHREQIEAIKQEAGFSG